MLKLLFIDNYDSFTYNVVHLLASQGAVPDVMLNDDAKLTPKLLDEYDALVVGPGPGNPSQQPRMMGVLKSAIDRGMPVFGVCLGLQAIGEVLGASVVHAPQQMHGKTSQIEHAGVGILEGIASPFLATRYHSLCLDPATMPPDFAASAHSDDAAVQAASHATLPVHGVQFHPESVLSEHGDAIVRNFLAIVDRHRERVLRSGPQ